MRPRGRRRLQPTTRRRRAIAWGRDHPRSVAVGLVAAAIVAGVLWFAGGIVRDLDDYLDRQLEILNQKYATRGKADGQH